MSTMGMSVSLVYHCLSTLLSNILSIGALICNDSELLRDNFTFIFLMGAIPLLGHISSWLSLSSAKFLAPSPKGLNELIPSHTNRRLVLILGAFSAVSTIQRYLVMVSYLATAVHESHTSRLNPTVLGIAFSFVWFELYIIVQTIYTLCKGNPGNSAEFVTTVWNHGTSLLGRQVF